MKRTKKMTQNLVAIAKQLPREHYAAQSAVVLEGSKVIERGILELDNQGIDPEAKYTQYIPLYYDKNHIRRIKRAFDSNGVEGVTKYVLPYVKEELRETYSENLKEV